MTDLSAYSFEKIKGDGELTVSRGRRAEDITSVLLLAAASEHPSPSSINRIKHAYSLRDQLDSAWAILPLELLDRHGITALLLDDPGGDFLDGVLRRAPSMEELLRLAIAITKALGGLHVRRLIHRDIKPAHIIANAATGDAWLTGFGLTSRLPRYRQLPDPPDVIAGTLAYMAPEQTGRMNRSVDSRSDLYSLGVTLYEMFVGVLPFEASDAMGWVHCHIARLPVAPHLRRSEIPDPLSAIILKLLAKTPEERYQTAAGVEADLGRVLRAVESGGAIEPFPLGVRDVPDRLLIPEKLYGREREVDLLLAAFDRVVKQGKAELVLVSGYSGVGKSSVVNELHKVLVPPGGLFASGKFDQFKRDIPYVTVAQAFQSLIRPLLTKPEAELSKWRDDLNQALSPNGSLVLDLVPELRLIIGEQPPVASLPPQEARARAHLAFRRFIGVFARTEHPLALFLDDLQWLDAATLDFLEDLLVQRDLTHLLLVGAYRDNEVDAAHPLMRRLSAIREGGGIVQEVRLAPLVSNDLEHLITDTLHCDPQSALPLSQLIHRKTAGNPFFFVQFLQALVEENLISFEHASARWRWDLDAIRAKRYTDNVVDLTVKKLSRLTDTTQKALQQFACIGNSAEAATLSAVLEISEQETEERLWEALHQELIVQSDGAYRFAHDRIQEAAYSLIAEESRAEAHLRIGRLLYAHAPAEKREEAIFEIVGQLNRGAELITADDERYKLAELNLIAGKRAKASSAYASALQYFVAGNIHLADEAWERRPDLIFQLELHRAECEFLTGESVVAAERVETLRLRAVGTIESASATCLGMDIYMTLGQVDLAVSICLDYMRRVGTDWPLRPTEEEVRGEYEGIWPQLASRPIEEIIDFPLMSDLASIATLDVLTKVSIPAWFANRNLYALVICRAVSLSIKHGNNDGSCRSYVDFSIIAAHRFGDYKNAFRFAQLGYDLIEGRGLKRFQAATCQVFAYCIMPWMKHLLACCSVMRQALDAAKTIGDLTSAAYSHLCLNSLLIAAGDSLDDLQREAEDSLAFAQKAKFGIAVDMTSPQLGLIRTLRGSTTKFGSFEHAKFDEIEFVRDLDSHPAMVRSWYWIRKLQALFHAGEFASAVDASLKTRPLLLISPSFEVAEYEFYSALARAACCDSATTDQRWEHLDALEAHYKQLEIWAEHCPENFENRSALVGAEIARIEGRALDAERLYEKAIRSARANGFVQNEAIAYEWAARFYAARGFETIGDAYLRNARNCYDRWGAHGKVKRLDERYPRLREGRTPAPSGTIDPPAGQLDVETVVKASQALSSEMVLPKLIEKLIRIAVENAGAERGLLFLIRDGEPRIEAEATTSKGGVEVAVRETALTASDLLQSALHYAIRTHERVLLDDASTDSVYSRDEYVLKKRSKSVLCLPIVKQTRLVGALYLENNLTRGAFTPDRVMVLQLLASQAAISLENAALYTDLQLQVGLLQHLPASAWTLKPDGTPDFVNQVWLEFSGQTLEFVRSHPEAWMAAVHPEDREVAARIFREGVHSGQGFAMETRSLRAKDGIYRWHLIQAVVLRDSAGKVLKFIGTTTDIDDQKRAEGELRASESKFRKIVESIPGFVCTMSPTGEILHVNERALDYFGKTLEQLKEWRFNNIVHPDELPRITEEITKSLTTGTPFDAEVRLRRADGVYRWFQDSALPVRDTDGKITGWYFLITEIDDQKRAEEALRQSQAELAHAARVTTMGVLAASIAHEVNQPLSGIMTNAGTCLRMLAADPPNVDGARETAKRTIRDGNRASEVITRLRALFSKKDIAMEPVDLNEAGREVIALALSDLQRKQVILQTEFIDGLPPVMGDRVQLQQVILNLLLNASEAMSGVEDHPRHLVIKTQLDHGNHVRLSVQDAGVGLVPEGIDKVFEAFYTTKRNGMGIGLSVSRSIIERHHGRLWAAPNDGPGATFSFSIPCKSEGEISP